MENMYEIISRATELRASDIHLRAGESVFFRVNGELTSAGGKISQDAMQNLLCELLTEAENKVLHESGNLDKAFSFPDGGNEMRLRINASLSAGCPQLAIRLLPKEIPAFETLGLPREILSVANADSGLFLVTGLTGAGKSTTLAALVQYINENFSRHIITLEDPAEYIYISAKSLVSQKEMGRDFAKMPVAVRNTLRQDPDVIVIGEIRDAATVSAALTAAETGHLVLATMHTADVCQSVSRITDLTETDKKELVRAQLSASLLGVLSQKLLRCKAGNSRVAATELLFATDAAKNLIREGKAVQLNNVMQTGAALGMHTFAQDIERLRAQGVL